MNRHPSISRFTFRVKRTVERFCKAVILSVRIISQLYGPFPIFALGLISNFRDVFLCLLGAGSNIGISTHKLNLISLSCVKSFVCTSYLKL